MVDRHGRKRLHAEAERGSSSAGLVIRGFLRNSPRLTNENLEKKMQNLPTLAHPTPPSFQAPRVQRNTAKMQRTIMQPLVDMPLHELSALSSHYFASGALDLGLQVDLDRYARMYVDEAPADTIKAALNNASLLLLTSGLDAHTISMTRQLLVGRGDMSCATVCIPPVQLLHRGLPYGISTEAARRFLGCCLGQRGLVAALHTAGAHLEQPNAYGFRPLHFAAASDQSELATALIARGANASAQTMFGLTPLHLAAARNATAVIEALVATPAGRGALGVRDGGDGGGDGGLPGRTPADVACTLGFRYAARLLEPARDCGVAAVPLHSIISPDVDCSIDVRSQSELSPAELVRDYMAIGKPVMIKGQLSGSEPTLGGWFSGVRWKAQSLVRTWGRTPVQVGDIPQAASFGQAMRTLSLAEYHEAVLHETRGRGRDIVVQSFSVDEPGSLAADFLLPTGSVLDPDFTALRPRRVLLTLGPRGAGTPMRPSRASVDILVRGSRTWLLQAPSDATHSAMHPADATQATPWPWPKESLYSCNQEAGDIIFLPDMWARATIHDDESLGILVETETGANEFSIDL